MHESTPVDLVILGPPGAGKGTQARLVAGKFGLGQLSTGDALRMAVKLGTKAGLAAKSVMEEGGLVSDEIVNDIVAETVDGPKFGGGAIFDGYPRTLPQAVALDQMLAARGRSLKAAISLEVDEGALVERISGRFTCANCGEGYHDKHKMPKAQGQCDICGEGEFKRRADDNEKAVKVRLREYARETAPLIEYYQGKKRLQSVDAMQSIDAIEDALSKIVVSVGGNSGKTAKAPKANAI